MKTLFLLSVALFFGNFNSPFSIKISTAIFQYPWTYTYLALAVLMESDKLKHLAWNLIMNMMTILTILYVPEAEEALYISESCNKNPRTGRCETPSMEFDNEN